MGNYLKINPLNLFTTLSNVTCLLPIYTCYTNDLPILGFFVASAGFWSALSHLYENHKHGMGLKIHSKRLSYWLNVVDRIAAWAVTGAFSTLLCSKLDALYSVNKSQSVPLFMFEYFTSDYYRLGYTIFTAICGGLSEIDKTSSSKYKFLVLHTLWHINVFLVLDWWIRSSLLDSNPSSLLFFPL